jgi:hypothetical protein
MFPATATAGPVLPAVAAGCLSLACLLAPAAALGQDDDAQARAILLAMTDYLAASPMLSFDVDSSFEIVTTDGQKLAIASSASVAVQRPDRLRVVRRGGFDTLDLVFDGQTFSAFSSQGNSYGQLELTGSIDQLIDTLHESYGRPLPAADLLGSDAGAVLLETVTEMRDLGSGVIRGQECDHLAFRTPEVDWQIWIAQGDVPHPCRFVITSHQVTGWPQYTLDFSAWGAGGVAPDFSFAPPEGARKAELADMPGLDDLAGIYSAAGGN